MEDFEILRIVKLYYELDKNQEEIVYAFLGFFVAIASWVQIGRIYSANALMGSGQELKAMIEYG